MTRETPQAWGLSADGQSVLQAILQGEGCLQTSMGAAAYELGTRACLQPATVRALHAAGVTLSEFSGLAQRVAELAHRFSRLSDRVLVGAAAYLASRVSALEGLQPSPLLDQAAAIAMVREVVRVLTPKARGLDTYAARRRALSELLLNGQLSADAYQPLKRGDLREILRLVTNERAMILEVVPPRNRAAMSRLLDKAQAVFGLPGLPPLDLLNADLAAALQVC